MAKLDRIVDKLGLGPEDHLVEIGSGWGAWPSTRLGPPAARVTTTTVSAEQGAAGPAAGGGAGLADRVTVLGRDYRDLEGTYDKLVSVEMIEAVDWRRHDEYLATCDRLLKPDGLALIQAIVIADRSYERAKHHDDYIRGIVFPGSCLPSVTAIADGLTRPRGCASSTSRISVATMPDPPGLGPEPGRPCRSCCGPPASTPASCGPGTSTSATARAASSSATSATSRSWWPGRSTDRARGAEPVTGADERAVRA